MKIGDYINFILDIETEVLLSEKDVSSINAFDDAVLMLDDIQDESKMRNGEPCYHITNGKEKTVEEASRLFELAFSAISSITKSRELNESSQEQALSILRKFMEDVERGQQIDLFLREYHELDRDVLPLYYKMISLFTGGHVKTSFELGVLISKAEHTNICAVFELGNLLGQLRQIADDVNDYRENHHEPLGDICSHNKRLPEIGFLLFSEEKSINTLSELLCDPENNLEAIRSLIFKPEVAVFINQEVQEILNKIDSELASCPPSYVEPIRKLVSEYKNISF